MPLNISEEIKVSNLPSITDKTVAIYSNSLVEARYSLGIIEQKLIFAMVSLISPNDKVFKKYKVNICDLARYVNIHEKTAIRELDKITDNILSEVIKIPRINEKGEIELLKSHWASHCLLTDKTLEFSFNNEMMPYLIGLKSHFTLHTHRIFVQFSGMYETRIYQLLKGFEYKGYYESDYSELREILGVPPGKYETFKSFRQWVLNGAKRKMEKKDSNGYACSDLSFNIVTKKEGRFIKRVRLVIIRQVYQERLNIDTIEEIIESNSIVDALVSYGIKKSDATYFVKKYPEADINHCIQMYEEKIQQGKVKDTSGSYLFSMLRAGAGKTTKAELLKISKLEGEKEKQKELIQQKEEEKLRRYYAKQIREAYISSLSPEQANRLVDDIKKELSPTVKNLVHDIHSPIIADTLNNLIPDFDTKLKKEMNKRFCFNNQ